MKVALPIALATLTTVGICRADVPSVAVDIAPVHSLVAQVMGTLGEPSLIVSSGASPHGYSLRPSQAKALQDASLVFWVSAGLTPWLVDSIDTLAGDANSTELLEVDGVTQLSFREGALFEAHDHGDHDDDDHHEMHAKEHHHDEHSDEHHDDKHAAEHHHDEHHDDEHATEHKHDEHSEEHHDDKQASSSGHEHDHGEHDPHAWLDPSNAIVWLDTIAEQLSEADPANAQTYRSNAAAGKAELEQLIVDVNHILDPVRGRSFIVFHDAYQYFESAFDFTAAGAISLSDASDPGPARIKEIQDRVSQANVTCVLSEPQFNPDLVNTVLDGTKAGSSVIDPLGSNLETGPDFYPKLIRELAQDLAECV